MENTTTQFSKCIDDTTFIVTVKQSESATKSLEAKFKEMCIHEALANFAPTKLNLEKYEKTS